MGLPWILEYAKWGMELANEEAAKKSAEGIPAPEHSEVFEAAHWFSDQAHKIASVAEAGEILLHVGKVTGATLAGIVGGISTVVFVGLELYRAINTQVRHAEQLGYLYGLMWEVLGEPGFEWRFQGGMRSAESVQEAWKEGIAAGRKLAHDNPAIHNRIMILVAYAKQQGFLFPEEEAMNMIWKEVQPEDLRGTAMHWNPIPGSDGHPSPTGLYTEDNPMKHVRKGADASGLDSGTSQGR